MELDDLKYKNRGELSTKFDKEESELAVLLKHKSGFVVEKLKANLNQELWITVVFLSFFTFMALASRGSEDGFWRYYGIIFAVLCLVNIGIMSVLKRRVRTIYTYDAPVRLRLKHIFTLISNYVRNVNRVSMAGVFILAAIFFHRIYNHPDMERVAADFHPIIRIAFASLFPVIIVGIGIVTKHQYTAWYNKRLKEIRIQIEELNSL